ncbi:transporter substrate-binding domain-containing protein [Bartonella sp. TP]|uniref:transporter substrate-binding domain-containing protein n=1 Tax=Bartonella sp. TP TaxID=3057550 RepID=UPI0025B0F4F6|nr:transporter substrate-binding domain-containing protein [Bartonella sp. TP]WJW80488.1 transporter substrate-binding domain-containing protein [Bartonella sp. TP]
MKVFIITLRICFLTALCIRISFFSSIEAVGSSLLPLSAKHAMFGPDVPDLSDLPHLRFLTSNDFYPFNYETPDGHMAGYNIDLAKAICRELHMINKCQVETVPFDQLPNKLRSGEGEAIIAGLRLEGAGGAKDISFTRPYMLFPARFLVIRSKFDPQTAKVAGKELGEQRIGVLGGTSHSNMLHIYFPNIKYFLYKSIDQLQEDLNRGNIDAIFGDGRILASLQGDYVFEGKAYYNERFLGSGMRIAALTKRQDILAALDYALEQIKRKGDLERLYFRYFPRDFYS